MRRTAIERKNPMRVGLPLKRSALSRSLAHARATAIKRVTAMKVKPRRRSTKPLRARLADRSGGLCEIQMPGHCRGIALDPCHRIGTKAGGRQGAAAIEHDRLSNVLHGCRGCHDWQTAKGNRKRAEELGLVVPEETGVDTEARRVFYRGQWAWLLDDGRVER